MTLYEQVARSLLSQIESGVYHKGDMLPCESKLIEQTGVSRVTVREALRRLAEMGVIETYKGKGSVVILDPGSLPETTEERDRTSQYRTDFLNSTHARILIEPEIAMEAAKRAEPADLAALEKALPGRGKNPVDLMDPFHRSLAAATHNPYLVEIVERFLQSEARMSAGTELRLTVPEKQKDITQEVGRQHRQIYEAVRAGNGEFAYFYMKEHLEYLLRCYENYFDWILE